MAHDATSRQSSSSITKVCPRTVRSSQLTLVTEQFHSTPETQTDESYNHPEDIEHFSHHETIEHAEVEREAKYQGITVEEALRAHEEAPQKPESAPRPKITRGAPKQDPSVKYKDIAKETENQSEWGTGDQGYKQPKSPGEKMRSVLLSRRDGPSCTHPCLTEKIYHTRYEHILWPSGA